MFYPGEHAKCPARVNRGKREHCCGWDLGLFAPPRTMIYVRVIGDAPKAGELVKTCRRCGAKLAIWQQTFSRAVAP